MNQSITLQEAHTRVCELEHRHDLLQFQIDGWCIWGTLRSSVIRTLINLPEQGRGRLPRLQQVAISLQDIAALVRLNPHRYVFATALSKLVEQEQNRYKDIQVDDLIREFGVDACLKIAQINNPQFLPRHKTALYKARLTLLSFDRLAELLARRVGPAYLTNMAEKISSSLRQEEDLQRFSPRTVLVRLRYFYWYKKFASWLFRRIRPAHLVTSFPANAALIAAAKEQSTVVTEMQHGVIHQYHNIYSWNSYATRYKAHMPIPDRFLLYGAYWQKVLDASGFWGETLRVTGSLRIDHYRQRQLAAAKAPPYNVLLTTQGIDIEQLIRFMQQFLALARGHLDIRLCVKLHPGYEARKTQHYTDAFGNDERVQIFQGNDNPSTFALLVQSHVHLSIYSTCHYEALGLGIPTVILPFTGHENVLHLYHKGYACLARTPEELLAVVRQAKQQTLPADIEHFFFAPGALENIQRELGR